MEISKLKDKKIVSIINQKNFKKIIVFAGKQSFYKSGANKILKLFTEKKNVKLIFKNKNIPDSNELKKLYITFSKFKPDLVIAIGGGTVLDYSKILNILDDIENLEKRIIMQKIVPKKKNYFLLALPTTAGSGAEVTSNAVIYVNKVKFSIEGEKLIPDQFILVSEFVIKNPKKIKSSSGFDAISQAIESVLSLKSSKKSVNFALASLELSLGNYLKYLDKPTEQNSSLMLLASNLSGKAISISKTIAPHAVSYPFTSYFNVSHGHAVSLTLNDFLKFNYFNQKISQSSFNLNERYKLLFKKFKVKNINELDLYLKDIKKKANLEDNFNNLGINLDKDIEKILDGLNEQRLKNNPIKINKKDIKEILLKKAQINP